MAALNKKYIEDFDKLVRDFEKLKMNPNTNSWKMVLEDLKMIQTELSKLKF